MSPFHGPPLHDRPGGWVGCSGGWVGCSWATRQPMTQRDSLRAQPQPVLYWGLLLDRRYATWAASGFMDDVDNVCSPPSLCPLCCARAHASRVRVGVSTLACAVPCPSEIACFRQSERRQRPRFHGFQHAPQARFQGSAPRTAACTHGTVAPHARAHWSPAVWAGGMGSGSIGFLTMVNNLMIQVLRPQSQRFRVQPLS